MKLLNNQFPKSNDQQKWLLRLALDLGLRGFGDLDKSRSCFAGARCGSFGLSVFSFFQKNTFLDLLTSFRGFLESLKSKTRRNLTKSWVHRFPVRDVWYAPFWWQKCSLYQVPGIRILAYCMTGGKHTRIGCLKDIATNKYKSETLHSEFAYFLETGLVI